MAMQVPMNRKERRRRGFRAWLVTKLGATERYNESARSRTDSRRRPDEKGVHITSGVGGQLRKGSPRRRRYWTEVEMQKGPVVGVDMGGA